jgi:hypothetical protein
MVGGRGTESLSGDSDIFTTKIPAVAKIIEEIDEIANSQ